MSQKNKKVHFRKSIDWDENRPMPPKDKRQIKGNAKENLILEQRNKAKMELINKYNMSESEAEETLRNIERKAKEKKYNQIEERKSNNEQIIKQEILQEKRIETEKLEIQRQKETARIELSEDEKINDFINKEDDEIITPIHIEKNNEMDEKKRDLKASADYAEENNEGNEDLINSLGNIFEDGDNSNKGNKEKENKKPSNQNTDEIISEHTKKEKSYHNVDELISNIIPDSEKEICIEVKNVSLSFEIATEKIDNLKELFIRTLKRNKGNKTRFQALKDISFNIYKGEKIGIIGYNGAGKSTLLNVITGIYPPEEGEVKTYGRISPLLALGAGFDHNYSGRENIFLNGAIMGYSKKFLQSKYDEIVEFSELEEFIDFPVKNYSSGMMAKLGFSVATIVDPDILIIDEVLGVGDVNFRKKSQDKLRSLMDSGTTVLLVSHSIPEIRKLCDKAIWIDKGRVREIGEVNDVCNHYLKDAEKATKEQLKDIRFR